RADDLGGAPVELLAQRAALEPAGIAGMPVVLLLVELVAGDLDLLGVHDDDEVAGVHVRRVLRLPLPAQCVGDLGREAAQGLPLGVHDVPVARDLSGLGVVGLHRQESGGPCVRRGGIVAERGPNQSAAASATRGTGRSASQSAGSAARAAAASESAT